MTNIERAHDPVCHATIHPTPAYPRADHDGRTWYFCSESCQAFFSLDPAVVLAEEVGCESHSEGTPEAEAEVARSYSSYEVQIGALLLQALGIGVEIVKSRSHNEEPTSVVSHTVQYAIWTDRQHAGRAAEYLRESGLFE